MARRFTNAELSVIEERARTYLRTDPAAHWPALALDLARALRTQQEAIDALGACILTQYRA